MEEHRNVELGCREKCEISRQECEAIAIDSRDCESRWDYCVAECTSSD